MNGVRARLALALRNARAREAAPPVAVDAAAACAAADFAGLSGEIALYPILRGGCGGCALELRGLFAPQAAAGRLGFQLCATPEEADVLALVGARDAGTDEAVREAMDRAPEAVLVVIGDCAMDGAPPALIAIPGNPPEPRAILAALAALKKV